MAAVILVVNVLALVALVALFVLVRRALKRIETRQANAAEGQVVTRGAVASVHGIVTRLEAQGADLVRGNGEISADVATALEQLALLERDDDLVGQLVIVHTPKPDDQSIRGVVDAELEGGRLILRSAVYLELRRDGSVQELAATGPVHVPDVSSVEVITQTAPATPAPEPPLEA